MRVALYPANMWVRHTVYDMDTACAWSSVQQEAPLHAATIESLFTAYPHHVIATVRADGAPRVGGTNVFVSAGVLWIGMMPQAARLRDLRRDPRCAIHSAPLDEQLTVGDVRLQLLAREAAPEQAAVLLGAGNPGDGVVCTLAVVEASIVRVEGSAVVIETWRPGTGLAVYRVAG